MKNKLKCIIIFDRNEPQFIKIVKNRSRCISNLFKFYPESIAANQNCLIQIDLH